jgi:hypothetical protein
VISLAIARPVQPPPTITTFTAFNFFISVPPRILSSSSHILDRLTNTRAVREHSTSLPVNAHCRLLHRFLILASA